MKGTKGREVSLMGRSPMKNELLKASTATGQDQIGPYVLGLDAGNDKWKLLLWLEGLGLCSL